MQLLRSLKSTNFQSKWRAAARDERGVAMITVIGASGVLAIMATAIVMVGVGNLRQAGRERQFEQALHVADSGVDHSLYRLRATKGAHTTGEVPPAPFASVDAERQWVLGAADAAVAGSPGRLVTTPEGQWVTIVAPNAGGMTGVIYSVGYVPSKADARSTRIVRAEYDFAPFPLTHAFITNGDLQISGNPDVTGSQGHVHANGDIAISGGPTCDGTVSASGTVSGTCGTELISGAPPIEVPTFTPRDSYHMSEYDLCPDGTVRAGPSYAAGPELPNTSDTPCLGAVLSSAGSEFRGWKISGSLWDYGGNQAFDGVYYVYQGSAKVAGSPGTPSTVWRATVIAEAVGSCPLTGGDIEVSGNPTLAYHDKGQPMVLIAGRDLKISGNPAVEGVMAAHEQVQVSGNPTVDGAFFVSDQCETPGSAVTGGSMINGNPTINFDGLEIPLGDNVRTTLWLEI